MSSLFVYGCTAEEGGSSGHDTELCASLVQHLCKTVDRNLLEKFIVCFLLDSNIASVRWLAHTLVLHIYGNSQASQREWLLDVMWSIWPDLPVYGSKAAQFVDLLGYFTIKTHQISDVKVRVGVKWSCKRTCCRYYS